MKDIKVGVKKMTRNRRKMIEQTGDSLLLSKHSTELSALFLLLSGSLLASLTVLCLIKVCKYFISGGVFENLATLL